MKTNILLLASLFILFTAFFSCKKDLSVKTPVPLSTSNVATPNDVNFVPFTVAAAAAKQVTSSHLVSGIVNKVNQSTANPSAINRSGIGFPNLSGKQILDSLAVPDNVNPSYYIFNYVGGGYVIMPADSRVAPILSYSNNGYFPHSGILPAGLANWLSVNHKNMQLLRKNGTIKQSQGVANLWAEFAAANPGSSRAGNIDRKALPPPPPCEPTTTIQTVGPLLQTAWAQGYPYNLLCPAGSYTDNNAPTGCVATAMAQVMYYWKMPAYYNWAAMPLTSVYPGNSTGNNAVATLMANIGSSVDMDYSATESDPNNGFLNPGISCTSALKNTFRYGSSAEASYNYLNVVANLNSNEPVLLSASTDNYSFLFWNWYYHGHEWVCDGYEQINTTWCPSNGNPGGGEGYLYLDMNWGWNEVGVTSNVDGWYDFDYWSVLNGGTQYYQYNQAMTYNIHP